MTPNFAVVRIQTPEWRGPNFWMPLFLVWILVILLSPVIFLVLVAIATATGTTIWRIIAIFWGILSGLRGTDIRVQAEDNHVLVRLL